MNEIFENQKITDTEKNFLLRKEQVEIISKAQKRLKELGDFGFYIPCHPTIDIVEYEKYMNVYLSEEQKNAYQKWKKEYPDMANFFTRED
jgi:hypothetical protein